MTEETKCGLLCKICGYIDIQRPDEAKPRLCTVCGQDKWRFVTLQVKG